ncbi:hypothetical protein OZX73_00905 [Bifidobacterium sp. ESL0775]|nr:hypothetical protein [Bifidobacterium sp. ESL0775]WEV69487.1 hypothetical protein OZX73_00905 [Bifidobacterium sp. ESL0775]
MTSESGTARNNAMSDENKAPNRHTGMGAGNHVDGISMTEAPQPSTAATA